jgi:hypothetical protein
MRIGQRTTNHLGGRRRVTLPHLLVRLCVMIAALAALDAGVNAYLHAGHHYDADWRLPKTMALSGLPGYVDHIVGLARDPARPVVLFLGASPTWGEMNSDNHHTYPAAFGRAARADGVSARVYNLGSNGAQASDDYFLTDRLAGNADLLVLQLTYTNFNPVARFGHSMWFPDLPRALGEPVSPQVASILGIPQTHTLNLSGTVDRTLGRYWTLLREHDALAARLFGQPFKDELFTRWQQATHTVPKQIALAPPPKLNAPFDDLDATAQGIDMQQFTDVSKFIISPADSELRMLDLLCADLQRRHVRAALFLSPIDVEVLDFYDDFDRKQYDANAAAVRAVVERHGLTFIDFNQPKLMLPSSAFADMTHTTDAGSALFAKSLYAKLAPLLREAAGEAARGGGAAGAAPTPPATPAAAPSGSTP